MTKLQQTLYQFFGFTSFKKGSRTLLKAYSAGRIPLQCSRLGRKSLCYQLPGYMLDGMVLIVSPLLSLMEDQVQQLKARGKACCSFEQHA